MRQFSFSLVLAFFALNFLSCSNDDGSTEIPAPCFEYRNQLNLEVLFINCSENALTFSWEFGDGETGEGFNPTHTYKSAGVYNVKVTAFADGSEEGQELEQEIIVEEIGDPIACLSVSTKTATPGQEIEFLNCSENSFKFVWDFGDGTTSSLLNPRHIFEASGTYKVILSAYAVDGSFYDTSSVSIRIGEKYLLGFRLLKYPATNGNATWDPELPFPLPIDGIGPEPDIKISYKRDFDNNANETAVAYDLESTDIPYEYMLNNAIKVAEDTWEFAAIEDDGFLGSETISDWSGTLFDKGENGAIELVMGDITLEVLYEVR